MSFENLRATPKWAITFSHHTSLIRFSSICVISFTSAFVSAMSLVVTVPGLKTESRVC
jgi:hypothetical protein